MAKLGLLEMIEPHHFSWIPFAGLAIGDMHMAGKPVITEWMEKAVIAAISALVVVYVNDKTQDKEIGHLTVQIQELKGEIKEIRAYMLEHK